MKEIRSEGTQTLASVRSAMRLLGEFSADGRELGVSDLSRRLALGKSTVHRLLVTLAAEHMVQQNPQTGKYRLGLRLYELGSLVAAHMDLHEAAAPFLQDLRNTTRETVQIAVLDGREVVYVERLESNQTLRLFARVGHRNDAHCTSTGKVLLAALPDAKLSRLLDGWALPRHTPDTITDPTALRAELAAVRRRGYAENINEAEVGVASIAAPIREATGEVIAALSVAGPVMRFDGASRGTFAGLTAETANAISRGLGCSRPQLSLREIG